MTEEELRSVAQEHDYSLPDKDGWICPSCEEKEKEAEKNSIQNAGQVCPTCPPEDDEEEKKEPESLEELMERLKETLKKLENLEQDEKKSLLERFLDSDLDTKAEILEGVRGLSSDDLEKIKAMGDESVRNDLMDIIFTVDYETTQMSIRGQRIDGAPHINNLSRRWLPEVYPDLGDCFDQAYQVGSVLGEANFRNQWNIIGTGQPDKGTGGIGHAWGKLELNDGTTSMTFDPRSREFGINRMCNSCQGLMATTIDVLRAGRNKVLDQLNIDYEE